MKKIKAISLAISLVCAFAGPMSAFAAGPAVINLGTAGNFVILAKTGISTTGTTSVVGDLGISPAAATYITGFSLILPSASAYSTSNLVTGKVYAPGYADPTPTNLTTAVLDMQTAYTDGMGRAADVTELGAGNIGGLTLTPGVYKWGTGLTIPTDVTLSGGANDTWIFQVAQNLDVSSAAKIVLSGGAQANNIFWVVAGQTTIGTTAVFNGNILDQTAIVLNTGATLNGRALAQSAVTLDASAVTVPTSSVAATVVTVTPVVVATSTAATVTSTSVATTTSQTSTTQSQTQSVTSSVSSDTYNALQIKINALMASIQAIKDKSGNQGSAVSVIASSFGQQVKAIANNFGKGSKGSYVSTLQEFLISQNRGSAAQALAGVGATSYFGEMTRAALAEFQASVGISPASGDFGPITRNYLSTH